MVRVVLFSFLACSIFLAGPVFGGDKLVVHEWGTFTALEDESGRTIGGINTDDEPVPAFVHDLHRLIAGPSDIPAGIFAKGLPFSNPDPDVRIRLETPVIYFHLPAGDPKPVTLDVDVTFHGGWLTQYYPDANATAPGMIDGKGNLGRIDATTNGTLAWHGLTVGTQLAGPASQAPVWLAPRVVDAASVTTPKAESERFLFYRGVGNIDPPVQVSRSTDGALLNVKADSSGMLRSLWLVDARADGRTAMRSLPSSNPDALAIPPISATFAEADYAADGVAKIRASLKSAMMQEGLFADEADALLNTWETSYFRRPGLRLFFLVPTAWTDRVLPLHLSVDAEVSRVMVGRVEIVSPAQRALLGLIAAGPTSSPDTWLEAAVARAGGTGDAAAQQKAMARLFAGETSLRSLPIDIPRDFRAYLELGRFRHALVLEESRRHNAPALQQFLKNYRLAVRG